MRPPDGKEGASAEAPPIQRYPTSTLASKDLPHNSRADATENDPDRDWLIEILRGDLTSDTGYELIVYARDLFRTGQLHDPEIVAALHVGDNKHLDDARRFIRTDP